MKVYPVILCGGVGKRLWPASRSARPKQFLQLLGLQSLFQETVRRVGDNNLFGKPLCIGNESHRFVIAEQLRQAGVSAEIVLEPKRRDSAPALCAGCLLSQSAGSDAIVLAMPADHHIGNTDGFTETVKSGLDAAAEGYLVTFGARPHRPSTAYGYIAPGEPVRGEAHRVLSFVEKPDEESAREFIAQSYLWNTGNFLLRADHFIEELNVNVPAMVSAMRDSVAGASRDANFLHLEPEAFGRSPTASIDYAVMEHTQRAAVVEASFDWSDIGNWSAVLDKTDKDGQGNALSGDIRVIDCSNNYIRSERGIVGAIGIENLIVVANRDAVLVAPHTRVEDVKHLVQLLEIEGRIEIDDHPISFRPWGSYEVIDSGDRFQVKRISVAPGGRLSLQSHKHRSEHWVVVRGKAQVQIDGAEREVLPNEAVYIPLGAVHRLENREDAILELIEVQSGDYLGEDDIERYEDVYGRL